jgi:hypothetical protein
MLLLSRGALTARHSSTGHLSPLILALRPRAGDLWHLAGYLTTFGHRHTRRYRLVDTVTDVDESGLLCIPRVGLPFFRAGGSIARRQHLLGQGGNGTVAVSMLTASRSPREV